MDDVCYIGSDLSCHVKIIGDPNIAARHCKIFRQNGLVYLEVLGYAALSRFPPPQKKREGV